MALVDDHALYRDGLEKLLASDPRLEVVAGFDNARECLWAASNTTFDLAVVDVRLPDRTGASLTRDLRRMQPHCRVLGLSMIDTPFEVAEMFRAGASGYALKSQATSQILEAMRTVASGSRYLADRLPADDIEALASGESSDPLTRLSGREREVFDLLVRGWTSERVALELAISPRTAQTHRQNLMKKLGVHSTADLLRIAARSGLLTD